MMKVMKFDGSIIEMEDKKTYDWTSGEIEYSLVYSDDGDLFGVITDGIKQNVLDDIVENPYKYDFPVDLNEYLQ